MIEEQVELFRQVNPRYGLPWAQMVQGAIARELGDLPEAHSALEESLSRYKANLQEGYVVDVLTEQSKLAAARGDAPEAARLADEAVTEARRGPRECEGLADTRHLNFALAQAASAHLALGSHERAQIRYQEAMRLAVATSRGLLMRALVGLQGL